jgi:beta-galactosidase GanA
MAPHLAPLPNGGHELIVNGSPYLCRAGELNNSSFSSPSHMRSVWPELVRRNVNTAFAAIGWEDVEPQEGSFVFEALDENIQQAREHDIKLVLLWFGSHKNGSSSLAQREYI